MTSYETEIETWRANRLTALLAEDGWVNLTDRVDMNPGQMRVGTAPDNDIVISVGPAYLGTVDLHTDGTAVFITPDGAAQPFAPVPDNSPRVTVAGLLLENTAVEGQHALRVRDVNSANRTQFPGIQSYPVDPAWRIVAKWKKLDHAKALGIDMVKGKTDEIQLTHEAHFTHDGQDIVLLPTHWKGGKPMFVVRDKTSGRETYGASRFLIGQVEGDTVVLDFNKAFNPPCAFTEFAICPLPPRQNILPFDIRAGEKKPH